MIDFPTKNCSIKHSYDLWFIIGDLLFGTKVIIKLELSNSAKKKLTKKILERIWDIMKYKAMFIYF